jgi:CheY-like chemotaxis protein
MNNKEYRILLADDDLDDCAFFAGLLNDLPFKVSIDIVHNGADLMEFLYKKKYDLPNLLFLDICMPRKSGLECIEEIKQDSMLQSLPVIVLTGSPDRIVADYLYAKGVFYYLEKSWEPEKTRKRLAHILELHISGNLGQPTKAAFLIQ